MTKSKLELDKIHSGRRIIDMELLILLNKKLLQIGLKDDGIYWQSIIKAYEYKIEVAMQFACLNYYCYLAEINL